MPIKIIRDQDRDKNQKKKKNYELGCNYINRQIEVTFFFKCLGHESSGVTNSVSEHVYSPTLRSRRPSEGRRHGCGLRKWGGESAPSSSSAPAPLGVSRLICVLGSPLWQWCKETLSLGWQTRKTRVSGSGGLCSHGREKGRRISIREWKEEEEQERDARIQPCLWHGSLSDRREEGKGWLGWVSSALDTHFQTYFARIGELVILLQM